jgi:hypothetical protein
MLHDDFIQVMSHGWNITVPTQDKGKTFETKFKNLRRVLRCWQSQPSNLATTITSNKIVLFLLHSIEEFRDLSLEEWNFRKMVQDNLAILLEQQRVYWQQRGRIKWVTLGDENTNFFHASATIKNNRNSIMTL